MEFHLQKSKGAQKLPTQVINHINSEIDNKEIDVTGDDLGDTVVTTTDAQTISGAKTLSGTTTVSGAATLSNASVTLSGIPTHADDAAAGTGGLTAGQVYQTSTGELRIKT